MRIGGAEASAPSAPLVSTLEEIDDQTAVGGKAWNLARMLRLGLPVPRGLVVTDSAFQLFLDQNRLREPIRELCAGVDGTDPDASRRVAGSILELVQSASVPERVREAIQRGRQGLCSPALIVRSSGLGEDSKTLSFAGQMDSCCDVRSDEEVERALLCCWASCWSERALSYQLFHGVRMGRMGVVVQEQVRPRAAGVLFTVSLDPSIRTSEMVGEYCLGHGEQLVSGRINPGRFSLSREGFVCRFLARPEQPGGGADPSEYLTEANLRALQRIGLTLEREFQGAQDVEWAIDHEGQLHVVQSRPITVLVGASVRPLRGADPGAPTVLWSNANINENYPDPVSPFLYSVAADGYYHYFRNLARAFGIAKSRIQAMEDSFRGIVGVHGARLYYNLSNIHAALRMAPLGDRLVESFNVFVGAQERSARSPRAESLRRSRGNRIGRLTGLTRIALKTAWQFLFLERRVAAFEQAADEYAAATHPDRLGQLSLPDLHGALRSFLEIRCHRWTNASLADAASMFGYGALKPLVNRAFPDREHSALHNKLLQGLPDLVSARPVSDLWSLSRKIQTDPRLRELFDAAQSEQIWARLQSEASFAGFLQEVKGFLESWGFRCSGELMLTVKSFQEDPIGVIPLLKAYAALEGESPVEALRRQAQERMAETRRVHGVLRRRRLFRFLPWPHEGTALMLVLRWTQGAIALRERARLKQSLLYSRCRRVLLRIGEELVSRGLVAGKEDVFLFTHQEISALVSGTSMFPDAAVALADLRRHEHTRLSRMRPPDTLTLPEGAYLPSGENVWGQEPPEADSHGEALIGIGACGGRVTGRATVVNDVSESGRLAAGDVLVTRQTDPGWAPVFFLVSGLVMERGGMLSHGAIIAREYGIPTVVGVCEATRKIRSGQTVEVDGDNGRVHLLV